MTLAEAESAKKKRKTTPRKKKTDEPKAQVENESMSQPAFEALPTIFPEPQYEIQHEFSSQVDEQDENDVVWVLEAECSKLTTSTSEKL